MEEINLNELFSYFLNKILLIILVVLVFLTGSIIYTTYIQKPMYSSYTTILLTKEENKTLTNAELSLNRNLVDTYSVIIKSNRVMEQVITNLHLNYNVGTLKNMVGVESVNDTEIIKITVKGRDATLASDIANETAKVFNNEIVKLYEIQNLGVIDVAKVSEKPYNVNFLKQIVLGTLVGLVVAFATVFIMFYFDTTVKNAEDVEKKLGLPVVGSIPLSGGKKHE